MGILIRPGCAKMVWILGVVRWGMSRTFKTVDYQATLDVTVRLGDCLPPDHLARFIVDAISQLDLSSIYARYGSRGGGPHPPQHLAGVLFCGYATGGCG